MTERKITPCLSCPVAEKMGILAAVEKNADLITSALYGIAPCYENAVVRGACKAKLHLKTVPENRDICPQNNQPQRAF